MAEEWRGKMIEAAVEEDDDAMEAYLEGEEPDVPTLRKLLRKGTLALHFVPVLGGSAFKNKGVQPLSERRDRLSAQPAGRCRLHGLQAGPTRTKSVTSPAARTTTWPLPAWRSRS